MNFRDIDWNALWDSSTGHFDEEPGSDKARGFWNEKAPSFARKPKRSDYIHQLIERMRLEAGDSVLDMGCGPGTLSIPLAKRGHDVISIDFSDKMVDLLKEAARAEGVAEKIDPYIRSWQQDWDGIPVTDIAVSSRSLLTKDLGDSIAKLEQHARKRVVITIGAGELPYIDYRLLDALGRNDYEHQRFDGLAILVNFLFAKGRRPSVSYIEYPRAISGTSRDNLADMFDKKFGPFTNDEQQIVDAFLDEHLIVNEEAGSYSLDYRRVDCWAYIEWEVAEH